MNESIYPSPFHLLYFLYVQKKRLQFKGAVGHVPFQCTKHFPAANTKPTWSTETRHGIAALKSSDSSCFPLPVQGSHNRRAALMRSTWSRFLGCLTFTAVGALFNPA